MGEEMQPANMEDDGVLASDVSYTFQEKPQTWDENTLEHTH